MATNAGKSWYTNGVINEMCIPGTEPEGFIRGKTQKKSHTIKGKRQYNNGVECRFFGPSDVIPDGFVLGPLPEQLERLRSTASNQRGVSKSETVKNKLSEAAKRRFEDSKNHPMYGKHHSTETIELISLKRKGQPSSIPKGSHYSAEQLNRLKQTKIDKYGSIEEYNRLSNEKSKQTRLERYGNSNYVNSDKRQKTIANIPNYYETRSTKTYKTIIEKYGSFDAWKQYIDNQAAKNAGCSSLEEYYTLWRTRLNKSRSTTTKLEQRFKEFLINNSYIFEQQYLVIQGSKQHSFDFAVFSQEGDLTVLVDCDGVYYHGYNSDETGKFVNTYVDEYRSTIVPQGVKFVVIVEGDEDEGYSEFCNCFNIDYRSYKNNIFEWCRSIEFPYPNYDSKVIIDSYNALVKADVSKFSVSARYGEKVLMNYYHSIYHARKEGKLSPYEAWQDDLLLKRCIDNRIIYKGNKLDPSKVLAGLSISGIAPKVSIFNPYLAKYLTRKYLDSYETIFDPFSGFGGRLLGVVSCDKKYIGQDINSVTIDETLKMILELKLNNVSVKVSDSTTTKGTYDCLLTCPPYRLKETWGQEIMNKSCDEWIDVCLNNFDCNRYVFVVDNTDKYKDYVMEKLTYKSHLRKSSEYVVVIDKNNLSYNKDPFILS